jgi:hypothetical protein
MRTNIMQRTKCLILMAIMVYSASLVFGSTAQAYDTAIFINNNSTHNATFLVAPERGDSATFSHCSAGTAHLGWCTIPPGANVQLNLKCNRDNRVSNNFNIRFYVDDNSNTELQYTVSTQGMTFIHPSIRCKCSAVKGSSSVISVSTYPHEFYGIEKCVTTITDK